MSKLGCDVNSYLNKIEQGDEKAFKDLFDCTYNHFVIYSYNYLYDINDAEDVVMEAYERMLKYIKSRDPNKDGYNWICKIIQNKAYDYNKKHNVYEPIDKVAQDAYFDGFDEQVLNKNVALQILKKLNNQDYKMVYLRFWGNLSLSEISKLTGIKKPTLHKRLRVLMLKLKKDLESVNDNEKN